MASLPILSSKKAIVIIRTPIKRSNADISKIIHGLITDFYQKMSSKEDINLPDIPGFEEISDQSSRQAWARLVSKIYMDY
ncbi:MAG: hypothetical protein MJB14_05290 [Spirochaetes bacterium]|nr:hypothetical protein [Spirochaetota bacterium]